MATTPTDSSTRVVRDLIVVQSMSMFRDLVDAPEVHRITRCWNRDRVSMAGWRVVAYLDYLSDVPGNALFPALVLCPECLVTYAYVAKRWARCD